MGRQSGSNLSAIFKRVTTQPTFRPEVLTAIDESIGYETFLGEDNQVCVRIQMLDGSATIEVPSEQLEGLEYITKAAMAINNPRTRRSRAEIEAERTANGNGNGNGIPEGQTPVSSNVMVNLMALEENEEENEEETEEENKKEAVVIGSRRRRN